MTHSIEYNSSSDTFVINFNWSKPFTWGGFPITSYTFSLQNESSGQLIDDGTRQLNGSDAVVENYHFITEGMHCYMLTFSVLANNSLGEGNESVSSVGHPIKGLSKKNYPIIVNCII